MATYFPISSNERDASMPILFLKEHLQPSSYSESTLLPGNMMMMHTNYSSPPGSHFDALAANSQQQNACVDISPIGASDSGQSQQEVLLNFGRPQVEEDGVNAWRDGRSDMLLMQPVGAAGGILPGCRGLSLSLTPRVSSGIQFPPAQYHYPNQSFSLFLSSNPSISGEGSGRNESFVDDDNSQNKQSGTMEYMHSGFPGSDSDLAEADFSPCGMSGNARTILDSKYLKAAQQLLNEVVSIRIALKQHDSRKGLNNTDSKEVDGETTNGTSVPSNPQDSSSNSPCKLSAAEKHELQNKTTKLLSMLDEVDRRYKQYNHQMQTVVSSFDSVAGRGAAKPYTAQALRTISRHFRCLRDAINNQLRVMRKSLGEQDASVNNTGAGISRLRYVDQQHRQQRALQHLGMMQQHAWRPQRGLPESSVSILRAWLFEHFLHPYPKDSDKIMLASQTGLTRSQVSNWFINARVRLWKPMVEEIYKEEIGDAELDSNSSSEITLKATKDDVKTDESREDLRQTATSEATEKCSSTGKFELKSDRVVADVEMMGPSNGSVIQNDAAYRLPELGRLGSGSGGVSLTLGLQHCEAGNLPVSVGTQHTFMAVGGDDVYSAAVSLVSETADFDCMDSGSRQHRFGSSHFLHDFVA